MVILLLLSCAASPRNPPEEPFWLKAGESLEAGDVTVTFAAVVADSRCPADVQCIWAGDAAVRVTLQEGSERGEVTLHTNGGPDYPKSARWGRYEITLLELKAPPQEGYFSVKVHTPSQSSGGGVA